jgi:hypothetical protein
MDSAIQLRLLFWCQPHQRNLKPFNRADRETPQ